MNKIWRWLLSRGIFLRLSIKFNRFIGNRKDKQKVKVINSINPKISEFIKALSISRSLGFDDYCILVHAWHESGGFYKVLGGYNYWGIKVPQKRKWKGLKVKIRTTEHERKEDGKTYKEEKKRLQSKYGVHSLDLTDYNAYIWKVKLYQYFIDFPNAEFAINWYCSFIENLYSKAYINRDNPIEYFNALISGNLKYATDVNYVEKLLDLYRVIRTKEEFKNIRSLLT